MAVHLHRSCLQSVPIAQPDGQNMTRVLDEPAQQIEKPNRSLTTQRKLKTENEKASKTKFFNTLLDAHSARDDTRFSFSAWREGSPRPSAISQLSGGRDQSSTSA